MNYIFAVLTCISLAVSTSAAQTVLKPDELHLRVNKLLLKRNLGELVNELSRADASTVDGLLFALDVFARAGRSDLVRQTVLKLSAARDLPPAAQRNWLLEIVRQKVSDDVEAQRLFYDVLAVDDGYYNINPFIAAWSRTGDPSEIDAWIEKRVDNLNSWSVIRLERGIRNGTVRSALDVFATRVRTEPNSARALNNYLGAVIHVQEYTRKDEPTRFDHEADWLYDIYPTTSANDAYEVATRVDTAAPYIAIRYYRDSLSRPVTESEVRSLSQSKAVMLNASSKRINWEKQLRYWTKQKLSAAYQRTGQAVLAQPLIEELIAAKDDDITTQDNFQLAGAVQSQSGVRVIESKVLQDAASASALPQYWRDRIQYYLGRNEMDPVVTSFRDAMKAIDSDSKARFIEWFGGSANYPMRTNSDLDRHRSELSQVLIEEFKNAPRGSELAFQIVSAASEHGLGLSDFVETYFIRRQDFLSSVFAARSEWNGVEKELLVEIIRDRRLAVDTKNLYISELETLTASGPINRRLELAEIFKDAGEHARRIPQLIFYLDHTPSDRDHDSARAYAVTSLFEAYVGTGNWKTAEKLMSDQESVFLMYLGNYLERLAICAGKQNAPDDAFRIWLKSVNFNGQSPFGLINLAETSTKPLLRRYYELMKQKDPSSVAAGKALALLK